MDWKKEFDILWGIAPKDSPKYKAGEKAKEIFKILIAEEKKKWIDDMRNGRICTSCGKPMEEGMSQWCQDCLENN
jgi:hypothetical protein